MRYRQPAKTRLHNNTVSLIHMRETSSLFKRLLPAAFATSVFVALAHALLVAIVARSIGLELVYTASISFAVVLVISLLGGATMLAVVGVHKLKPVASLLLFLIVIQAVAIGLEMYFFESGLNDISWQYAFISAPASLIAWHRSVYYARKNT